MKNAKHYLLALTVLLSSACSDSLMNPTPTVDINPEFPTSGFTDADIVSLNDTDTKQITYNRTYGISRALTMQLTVNEEALKKYNAEKSTNYTLLPAEFYSMPESVTFEVQSKNANFEVKFNSKKLYEKAGGIQGASNYVLPIVAIPEDKSGVDNNEEANTILLHINMAAATVSVYVPSDVITLDFVSESGATEDVAIEASINFVEFDGSYITMEVDKDADLTIDDIEYELLPEANYSFDSAIKNELGEVVVNGKINADGLSPTGKYLLPCRIKSSNAHYIVTQSDLVYFAVNMTSLKVSITDASATKVKAAYTSLATLNGSVEVSLNSLVPNDLTINLAYDASLIDAFNTAHSKTYKTLPDGAVTVNSGKIASGIKSGKFDYSIDISSVTLSNGEHYLVPIVLDESAFEIGEIAGSEVIYLDVARNLVGTYDLTVIDNERPRNVENTIWFSSECDRGADWADVMTQAQYGFGGDGKWYCVLFSVLDEDMPGKANCKKIEIYSFLELLVSTGGSNDVSNNNSYFNTVTGEVYIDCKVYESWFDQHYKETYSFKLPQ